MKKLLKALPILMTVFMVLMTVTPVLATVGGITIDIQTEDAASKITPITNNILGIIQVIGTVVAVGVLMVLGIKYMMGSAEEKAEYKKTMIPYLVGAILLFAAVHIAAAVVGMAQSAAGAGGSGNTNG